MKILSFVCLHGDLLNIWVVLLLFTTAAISVYSIWLRVNTGNVVWKFEAEFF